MVALTIGLPTALPWLIFDDSMGQIQAQDRHLTGTLSVARPTSSP
jgi:hypothetical protein